MLIFRRRAIALLAVLQFLASPAWSQDDGEFLSWLWPKKPAENEPEARRVFGPLWTARTLNTGPCLLSAFMPASDAEHCASWTRRETSGVAFARDLGLAVVGGSEGFVSAYEAASGRLLWRTTTPGAVVAKPLLVADHVFVGTDDGHVVKLNVRSGAVVFDVTVDAEVTETPVVAGAAVLVTTGQDSVYALSVDNGAPLWLHKHPLPRGITLRGQARPFVSTMADGTRQVFIGHASGRLTVLRLDNGTAVSEFNLSNDDVFGDLDADPFVDGNTLFAASQTRGVYALDPTSGAEKWRFNEGGIVRLVRGGPDIVVAAGPQKVIGLDRATGKPRWRFTFKEGAPTRPVIAGGRVHIGSDRGSLYVLDLASGRPLQYLGDGLGVASDPEVVGDMLFTVTTTGTLMAASSAFGAVAVGAPDKAWSLRGWASQAGAW